MEILREEVKEWVGEMKEVEGNQVELFVQERVNHDVLLTGNRTGFEEEGRESAEKAGEWVRRLRAASVKGWTEIAAK